MLLLRETGVKPVAPLCSNWDGWSSVSRPVHSAVENEVDVNLVEHCDRTCGTRANFESIPSRCDVYVLLRGRILRCYMDVVTMRYVYKLYRINNRHTNDPTVHECNRDTRRCGKRIPNETGSSVDMTRDSSQHRFCPNVTRKAGAKL